jgi:hypothetical protein
MGGDAPPPRRQLVEPAAAFVGFLDPGALDPATLLEALEQGVEGIDVKLQLAARTCLDQLAEQFRRSPLQLAVERARVDI